VSRYAIIGALIAFILIVAFLDEKRLSKRAKIIVISILFAGLIGGFIYEQNNSTKYSKRENLINKFNQNIDIICGDVIVNKSEFEFANTTSTFIGKKSSQKYQNLVISLKDCKVDE